MGASSEWHKVLRRLRKDGWVIKQVNRSGHWRAYPPSGARWIALPNSPSGGERTWKNMIARLRKHGADV
jgi:hypothetical protein